MSEVKIIAMYPPPKNAEEFEKVYLEEHIPMAIEKLQGTTRFVATKVLGSPTGPAPYYRIAEIYFPSMEALQACISSPGGQETVAHANSISTGGPPVIMIGESQGA